MNANDEAVTTTQTDTEISNGHFCATARLLLVTFFFMLLLFLSHGSIREQQIERTFSFSFMKQVQIGMPASQLMLMSISPDDYHSYHIVPPSHFISSPCLIQHWQQICSSLSDLYALSGSQMPWRISFFFTRCLSVGLCLFFPSLTLLFFNRVSCPLSQRRDLDVGWISSILRAVNHRIMRNIFSLCNWYFDYCFLLWCQRVQTVFCLMHPRSHSVLRQAAG